MSRMGCGKPDGRDMARFLAREPWPNLARLLAPTLPTGAARGWCPSRSSKPVSRRSPPVGRFDSCAAPLSPRAPPVRLQDERTSPKETDMKYALLIYPKPGSHEELPADEGASVSAEYLAFRDDPRCL